VAEESPHFCYIKLWEILAFSFSCLACEFDSMELEDDYAIFLQNRRFLEMGRLTLVFSLVSKYEYLWDSLPGLVYLVAG